MNRGSSGIDLNEGYKLTCCVMGKASLVWGAKLGQIAAKLCRLLITKLTLFSNRRKILAVTTQLEQLRKESLKKIQA